LEAFKFLLFLLAALTSFGCMALLFRGYARTGLRLLLWSALCFIGLTVNNLLLVTLVEEALFRGYIQGGLTRCFKNLPYGENLALLLASLLFGLAHVGAGWQWVLLASLAGVSYGLAYRFGGLGAAIATHFGLNLLHFGLFTYPMLAS